MAKTPEQKAAEQAAKDLKKAEKAAIEQLKAAQKAELFALEKAGATKAEIKAEKKVNETELSDAKTTIKQPGNQVANVGIQQVLPNNQSVILSNAGTYSGDRAATVQDSLGIAAANYANYGVNNVSKSGNTTVGIGLDKLVKYEAGEGSKSINKIMDRAKTYVGQSFTEDQLKDSGVKLKEVKGMPGVYQWKTSGGEVTNYTFFVKDPNTGEFKGTGVNRTFTPDTSTGFTRFLASDLGKVAMIGASIFGAPYLGSMITGSLTAGMTATAAAALNAAVGNAVISAATTAASGGDVGDILKSAGTSFASSQIGSMAGGALPPGLNDAINTAVRGAAMSASNAILNGANLSDAVQAGLQGAAVGAVGSGVQQLASNLSATGATTATGTDTGLSYDPGEGYGTGQLPGAGSTTDVANFFGDTSGQTTIPNWARAGVEAGTIQPNYDGTYTQVYDDGSAQVFNAAGNVIRTTNALDVVNPVTGARSTGRTDTGLSYDPGEGYGTGELPGGGSTRDVTNFFGDTQGAEIVNRDFPYDPNYTEPSVWDSIKNLGDAVYEYAVDNPWTVAAIVAGTMTLGDLVSASGGATGGGGGKKGDPVVVDPLDLDIGGGAGVGTGGGAGTGGVGGGFGGVYGTPTFAPRNPLGLPAVVPQTYADRALLEGQAPGSPIARAEGIAKLAAPSPIVPTYVPAPRPAENVSPEGFRAEDIASLLDAQEAARYNAAPAVQSGEVAAAGRSTNMREGGIAQLAKYGRYGDTMLAHINPNEAAMLKAMGGAGTINPVTGLPEFYGIGDLTDDLRKGVRTVGRAVGKVVKPVARYIPYVAPFIPGLNVAQAAMLSGVAGAMGGDKGFDFKRGLMSGLMTYGIGSLAEGLNVAGQPGVTTPEPMSVSSVGEGVQNVLTNAPGAREALATKFGTGTAMTGIMGASGVAAIDEQNAFAAEQEKLMREADAKRRRLREQSQGLVDQYPIRFAAEGGEIDTFGDSFAEGGALPPRFLSGGGDGMSDSIPANIEGQQEARLADGEFVVPADVVSGIGNGSSKAGAKQLYAMMDRVRKARTGTTRQGKEINPMKFMPA